MFEPSCFGVFDGTPVTHMYLTNTHVYTINTAKKEGIFVEKTAIDLKK